MFKMFCWNLVCGYLKVVIQIIVYSVEGLEKKYVNESKNCVYGQKILLVFINFVDIFSFYREKN